MKSFASSWSQIGAVAAASAGLAPQGGGQKAAKKAAASHTLSIALDALDFGPELLVSMKMTAAVAGAGPHERGGAAAATGAAAGSTACTLITGQLAAGAGTGAGAPAGTAARATAAPPTEIKVTAATVPLHVVLIVDKSGSMGPYVETTIKAARETLANMGLPLDHPVQVIFFADASASTNVPTTVAGLDGLDMTPGGRTYMEGAVRKLGAWAAAQAALHKTGDLLLLVTSDGIIDDATNTRQAFRALQDSMATYQGQVFVATLRLLTNAQGSPDTETLASFCSLATNTASTMATVDLTRLPLRSQMVYTQHGPQMQYITTNDIMARGQALTATKLQDAIQQTLPTGQLRLSAQAYRVEVTCPDGAMLRRLPTDTPTATLQFYVAKGHQETEAYFLVSAGTELARLRANGRELGGLRPRQDWAEEDFQAFLVFAETQARMWMVAGATNVAAQAKVQFIATWCKQLHVLASARAKDNADGVHPSTRARVAALARTLRTAHGSLLQTVGQLGNADKLRSIQMMNADQQAQFVQSAITSLKLAKRATQHIDYGAAAGGVDGMARRAVIDLAASLLTLRVPEPADAAASFFSLESYRQALVDAVTELVPVIEKHPQSVKAADILRVVGGLGLGFRGTAGSFVDPWAFRVARVYMGMYVSEQDVRSTTVLTDPTRMPELEAPEDEDGDGDSACGAGVGMGTAAAGAATAATTRRLETFVDPLTRNTYLTFPGVANGIITGVLPLEALDPVAHGLYRQTSIAELQASVSCRALLAPLASDRIAIAAAVLLGLVTAIGGDRAPTALEHSTLAMVRTQVGAHFAAAARSPLSPFNALFEHLAAADPVVYFTGDDISDLLKVYAPLLSAPQCAAVCGRAPATPTAAPASASAAETDPVAAADATSPSPVPSPAPAGIPLSLQRVLGACAWLLVYKAARKHFRSADAAAASTAAAADAAAVGPPATQTTQTMTRKEAMEQLLGWDADADAACHPVGEPLTPTLPFVEPTPPQVAVAFARAAEHLRQSSAPDRRRGEGLCGWAPTLAELVPVARFAAFPDGDAQVTLDTALGYGRDATVTVGDATVSAASAVTVALVMRAIQCVDESHWVNKETRRAVDVPRPSDAEGCAAIVRGIIVDLSRAAYQDRVRAKEKAEATLRLHDAIATMLRATDMDAFIALLGQTIPSRTAPGFTELEQRLLQAAAAGTGAGAGISIAAAEPLAALALAKLVVIVTGHWRMRPGCGQAADDDDASCSGEPKPARSMAPVWCAGNRHPSSLVVRTLASLLEADDPSGEGWSDAAPLLARRVHTYRGEPNRHKHGTDFPSYFALGFRTARLMKRDAPDLWNEYRRLHVSCCTYGADVEPARPGTT